MRKALMKVNAAAGVAQLLMPGAAWAQTSTENEQYAWGPHMMWWDGGFTMLFAPLFFILFLAVLIAAVVFLIRGLNGPWPGTAPPHHMQPGPTPLDILKERFARGEIDKEEFEERRRILGE